MEESGRENPWVHLEVSVKDDPFYKGNKPTSWRNPPLTGYSLRIVVGRKIGIHYNNLLIGYEPPVYGTNGHWIFRGNWKVADTSKNRVCADKGKVIVDPGRTPFPVPEGMEEKVANWLQLKIDEVVVEMKSLISPPTPWEIWECLSSQEDTKEHCGLRVGNPWGLGLVVSWKTGFVAWPVDTFQLPEGAREHVVRHAQELVSSEIHKVLRELT